MATFLELRTELLSKANRSSTETEVVTEVNSCINDAIRWANRGNPFKYAERASSITIDGSSYFYDVGSLCDGKLIGINSIQRIADTSKFWGYPLEILTMEQVNTRRYRSSQMRSAPGRYASDSDRMTEETSFDISTADTDGMVCVLLGTSIGFYPKPTSQQHFMITYNSLLNPLANDGDTNFFTEIGKDFIVTKALQSLYYYLKEPKKAADLNDKVVLDWEALLKWDQRAAYSHAISS
jgi:hypothetical protein